MNNTKTYSIDESWEEISSRICSKCIDGDGHGNCRLASGQRCELKERFPRIVETIASVQSDNMEPYIEALRKNICAECVRRMPDGACRFRTTLECGLDRYFPLIVEVIEGMSVLQK